MVRVSVECYLEGICVVIVLWAIQGFVFKLVAIITLNVNCWRLQICLTLLCCIICLSVEGIISIELYGVFPALHSTLSSVFTFVHMYGVIVAIIDGEYS
jgi:hypothetical protein